MIYLGEVDTERVHVQSIQETGKRLAKSSETLVHKLEMHHVCFQVGHGVRKLAEGRLKCI